MGEAGKDAVKWTKLWCHDFVDNQVRLQLFALALLNIVGCHVLGCKRKGGQPSAGAYGPPPAAQP